MKIFRKLLLVILVLFTLGILTWQFWGKYRAANTVTEAVIESVAMASGVPKDKVEEVLDSIPDEKKEEISEIVEEHLDAETMIEALKIYEKTKDVEKVAEQIREKVTDEEYDELKELFENIIVNED